MQLYSILQWTQLLTFLAASLGVFFLNILLGVSKKLLSKITVEASDEHDAAEDIDMSSESEKESPLNHTESYPLHSIIH